MNSGYGYAPRPGPGPGVWGKRVIAAGVALFALAHLDTHVFHWSAPAGPAVAAPVDGWSLPVDRALLNPAEVGRSHHDYPAWDWPAPTGTQVVAVRGGTVSYVGDSCGLGVRVTDPAGVEWTYCHASTRVAAEGSTVGAGDPVVLVGSTGRSTGPHLHLQVRAGGRLRCPQPLLRALYDGQAAPPDPAGLPTTGCSH